MTSLPSQNGCDIPPIFHVTAVCVFSARKASQTELRTKVQHKSARLRDKMSRLSNVPLLCQFTSLITLSTANSAMPNFEGKIQTCPVVISKLCVHKQEGVVPGARNMSVTNAGPPLHTNQKFKSKQAS